MQNTSYKTALWGFSWEEALTEAPVQGIANLTDSGIMLDIPFGQLLSEPGHVVVGPEEQLPESADYLYGFSQDGFWLVIKDCAFAGGSYSNPGGPSQKIRGSYLFASRSQFDSDGTVVEARLGYRGLREWVDESPFRFQLGAEPSDAMQLTYGSADKEGYNKTIYSDEKLDISILHDASFSFPTTAGSSISHDCLLLINFKEGASFSQALDWIGSLSRFLSLCMGFLAEITTVELMFEGCENWVHCHFNCIKAQTSKIPDVNEMPFPYPKISAHIALLLRNWLELEDRSKTAANIVISLLVEKTIPYIDLRFTAASQALEAFTKVNVSLLAEPKDSYASHKKRILDCIADPEDKEWFKAKCQGNQKGQRQLLNEFCEANEDLVKCVVPDIEAFKKCQIDSRNYYTHRSGDELGKQGNVLQGEQLYWHTQTVILICYCFIWRCLGLDSQVIIQAVEEPYFRPEVRQHAKKLYCSK